MKLRFFSVLLVLILLISALPVAAAAEEYYADTKYDAMLLEQALAIGDVTEDQVWYDDDTVEYEPETFEACSTAALTTAGYPTNYPNTWTNTGNQAVDIAMIALTQVGYEEGAGNHTKYNAWYYGSDTCVSWCGTFICWCANQAGVPTSVLKRTAIASGYSISNMQNNSYGAPAYAFGKTKAQVGDVAYITSGGSTSNHVGLVVAVDSTYIYTVEGNASDTVALRKYTVAGGYQAYASNSVSSSIRIVFYARPKYAGTSVTPTNPQVPADNTVAGFSDVAMGQYYSEAIAWAVDEGITKGTTNTTFEPEASCTRGQVVTFLYRDADQPKVTGRSTFTDVKTADYFYTPVLWALSKGITTGTSDTTFDPANSCTRAQAVTFLWRAAGSPEPKAASTAFRDVPSDEYYYKAVLWAVENAITTGTGATTFEPDMLCTRAQIVTFLYRASLLQAGQ